MKEYQHGKGMTMRCYLLHREAWKGAGVSLHWGSGKVVGITSLSSLTLTAWHLAKQGAGPGPGQQQQRHELASSAVQALGSGQVAPTKTQPHLSNH